MKFQHNVYDLSGAYLLTGDMSAWRVTVLFSFSLQFDRSPLRDVY